MPKKRLTMKIDPREFFRGKRVLLAGLCTLGGGVATANWLLRHGVKLTITDLRSKKELKDSLKKLNSHFRFTSVMGKHRARNFSSADVVVVNPAVPRESKFLRIARRYRAQFENDASIFFRFARVPIIG